MHETPHRLLLLADTIFLQSLIIANISYSTYQSNSAISENFLPSHIS